MANNNHSPLYNVWKPELYKMQLEAPTPKAIMRQNVNVTDPVNFYGYEYHGVMDHKECKLMLANACDGSYLIRKSPDAIDYYTLSLKFAKKVKHYKIYYRLNFGHYLNENFKRFETVHELVADGLIDFYMRIHAAPIIQEMMSQTKNSYQQSPYMTLNRRKLKALSNDLRKSLKSSEHTEKIQLSIIANIDDSLNKSVGSTTSAYNNNNNIVNGNCDGVVINHNNNNNNSINDDNDVLPIVYEKFHAFKVHTFKGLNWCEFCANFLWGFTAQGVKCEDCGFIAHSKCSELVPAKCVPDLKCLRGVFGTDLTTLVAAHHCTIPFIIKQCVEEVEARGMLQEGIYRVSGFADEIDALKLALDRDGEKTDMSENVYSNINVIAGTLKLYLRLLPIPLITFQSYPLIMASTRCKSVGEQVLAMREAIKHLPTAHYNCLKYMIEHLNRVASHHIVNKMTEYNLATVFAPTLIAIPQHLTDLSQEIFMLSSLITNCQPIFLN